MIIHPIEPVFDAHSRVLILGSFPSVRSREEGFFYGHPRNRFWKVLAAVFGRKEPLTIPEKRALLLEEGVALWDVIASCEIDGSADSTIRHVAVNELSRIFETAQISQIFVNGKTAQRYYDRYLRPVVGREAVCLPSTSPANAAWSVEKLTKAWAVVAAPLLKE